MSVKLKYNAEYTEDHGDFVISVVKTDADIKEVANFFFEVFLEGKVWYFCTYLTVFMQESQLPNQRVATRA